MSAQLELSFAEKVSKRTDICTLSYKGRTSQLDDLKKKPQKSQNISWSYQYQGFSMTSLTNINKGNVAEKVARITQQILEQVYMIKWY